MDGKNYQSGTSKDNKTTWWSKLSKTKKALVIVLVLLLLVAIFGKSGKNQNSTIDTQKGGATSSQQETPHKDKVKIINFATMDDDAIDAWCKNVGLNCKKTLAYSDTIAAGGFISQSNPADAEIEKGNIITYTRSKGKAPTSEQTNALAKARSYSDNVHLSKQGIYKQLTSQFEGFSPADAQYAIDNLETDYNKNALEKAKNYQSNLHMSKNAIYHQLTSQFEGFTAAEAQYAIDNLK